MSNLKLRSAGIPVLLVIIVLMVVAYPALAVPPGADGPTLNAADIPKFETELTGPPPAFVPDSSGEIDSYSIIITQSAQAILPKPFPKTIVWGYGGKVVDLVSGKEVAKYVSASPSATFEATRGTPIKVKWQNAIGYHIFPVDPTLHWADPNGLGMLYCEGCIYCDMDMGGTSIDCTQKYPPGYTFAQKPVPLVTHLHGGEVQSTSDGHPEAWWTVNGKQGEFYNTYEPTSPNAAVFYYPNEQPATTLWYHDHALGITRINVMSGLAGFYLLRDPTDPTEQALDEAGLDYSKYEVPLVFQDREFNKDGSFWFPSVGNSPADHPYWNPEFFGEVIMVNGKAWPKMYVDQGVYRFRLLDGSNARAYTLSFSNGMTFTQIGSDGGFLQAPAELTEVTIAPGERADILVDFSGIDPGTEIILENSAVIPLGNAEGQPPTANTAVTMKFIVTENDGPEFPDLPTPLNQYLPTGSWPTLPAPTTTRTLVLQEVMNMSADEPIMVLLNGQKWGADISEDPVAGTTEEWIVVNPTADTHPIHLHLVQFQLVERIPMDTDTYQDEWYDLNGGMPPYEETPEVLPIGDFVTGDPEDPADNEMGWKDTVQMPPGYASVIRIRFAPIDGSAEYPFDPSDGPGYVWHCHILDHEDNEMMRPYVVT